MHKGHMILKKLDIGIYEIGMIILVIMACLLRIVFIAFHDPVTNSDEAVMGLMTRHIAYQGQWPIFFYGQGYMGSIEAYLGAILFHLRDSSSLFTLRLGLIFIFALFISTMYFLTRQLYNRSLALFTTLLLGLGSFDIISRQLKAFGGYPEMLFFVSIIFFVVNKLVFTAPVQYSEMTDQERRQRWCLYALLGLLVGLGIWSDPLIVTFIAPAGLLLLIYCRREIFSKSGLLAVLGILIGVAPMIYYNLTRNSTEQSTLAAMIELQSTTASQMAQLHLRKIIQLSGTIFMSIPTITGFNPLCPQIRFPGFENHNAASLHCVVEQGGWTLGYFLLWISAALISVFIILRLWRSIRQSRQQQGSTRHLTYAEQLLLKRHSARLCLLISVALTLLTYINNPAAALEPTTNARYLLNLLVATPALLWPLWNGFIEIRIPTRWTVKPLFILRMAVLCLILFFYANGTVGMLRDMSSSQKVYQQQTKFINDLLRIGATHIYTEYWTCYNIAFQSDEKIDCVSLTNSLQLSSHRENRYTPYIALVQNAPGFTYVFPDSSPQALTLAQQIKHVDKKDYTKYAFDGYVVYRLSVPLEAH